MKKVLTAGETVKVKYSTNNKSKNFVWRPAFVVECYKYFILVQFEKFRKCFWYDEIEPISKKEYHNISREFNSKKLLVVEE